MEIDDKISAALAAPVEYRIVEYPSFFAVQYARIAPGLLEFNRVPVRWSFLGIQFIIGYKKEFKQVSDRKVWNTWRDTSAPRYPALQFKTLADAKDAIYKQLYESANFPKYHPYP